MDAPANTLSLAFVESLLADYLRDPASVPPDWHDYFQRMQKDHGVNGRLRLGPTFRPHSIFHANGWTSPGLASGAGGVTVATGDLAVAQTAVRQHRLEQLIRNYRVRGHMIAKLDPLGMPQPQPDELDPAHVGLTEADMDRPFSTPALPGGTMQTLRQILQRLRNTYCRSVGVQFMHIDDLSVRQWLQSRMESTENHIQLSRELQRRILHRLSDAAMFEQFIQRKYIGAKSFSLEGAETLIPLLDLAIEKASGQGIRQMVLAMAHRGRLNVLANIMQKPLADIFAEFEGLHPQQYMGGGDVKYHLGYSHDWTTESGKQVHLSLCFNPSHLEFINPVALGRVRAKQDRVQDAQRQRSMALLIHGDAAFAGEGVIQEILNMSQLPAYFTGGTLHVVVNNQLGFTTSPAQGRSTPYCTDVAKMLQSPIFHVNGEDPEAVMQVVTLAMDFRQHFRRDVIIDMYCFRRRGHNEGDEPAFTQPHLYKAIRSRPAVRDVYLEHLLELGGVSATEAQQFIEDRAHQLETALADVRQGLVMPKPAEPFKAVWADYSGASEASVGDVDTGVAKERLTAMLRDLSVVPEGFAVHRKLEKFLQARRDMAQGKQGVDWTAAEALALGSISTQGIPVRMTGQDVERGTFSQRHAILHDHENDRIYMPLMHLAPGQARIEIANSPLTETGVLGFEYGYSLDTPDGLTLWEAQFGDFVNAAQVIIDQFIASAQDKWNRLSGITLLLPHGFEGQGPEHSSARLERWLVLSAEENIQVVYPTTPAQYFHVLRRQVIRPLRKPLVVLTPKSLLRHERVVSPLDDFAQGAFGRVIPDDQIAKSPEHQIAKSIRRVLLCTGKIYYELLEHREKLQRDDVAIIRIEQLYPFPYESLRGALEPYGDGTQAVWVQEEPRNMGAWPYLAATMACNDLFHRMPLNAVTRAESASPATGSHGAHKLEQDEIISKAFGGK
ncbi:MAG: 2-oxoglutarate dehydrogenase E1 component [Phycisphaeraceae bacterium]